MNEVMQAIFRCQERGVVRTEKGSVFICPTPRNGDQSYLHSLYAPCSELDLFMLETILGFALPREYRSFMALYNGANLFNNTIAIYGLGGNFSRSLCLDGQSAISIDEENQFYKALRTRDWSLGWRVVGSAVALQKSQLVIRASGETRFETSDGKVKTFASFFDALLQLIAVADRHFGCEGFCDESYDDLEAEYCAISSGAN